MFQKGRYILDQSVQVVSREVPTEDPLLDLDQDEDVLVEDEEVQDMITQLAIENPCTVNELALADDDLADFSDEQWEDFLARSHALKTQVKTVMWLQNLRIKLICHLNFKKFPEAIHVLKMSITLLPQLYMLRLLWPFYKLPESNLN